MGLANVSQLSQSKQSPFARKDKLFTQSGCHYPTPTPQRGKEVLLFKKQKRNREFADNAKNNTVCAVFFNCTVLCCCSLAALGLTLRGVTVLRLPGPEWLQPRWLRPGNRVTSRWQDYWNVGLTRLEAALCFLVQNRCSSFGSCKLAAFLNAPPVSACAVVEESSKQTRRSGDVTAAQATLPGGAGARELDGGAHGQSPQLP
ncbi:hypothetical protein AMEX_G19669 [Astyanax mexicanus]|uniref:Uncharacterized protein n=1 Tax=Astyanax mexicanus TaxID=7994 RepID=A0A8T2L869_ASTMX|nr:hypothetical protein AMEX_G19669 [Astyanax mexicanus]